MRRGLGQVDVTALAKAFLAGQINPTYGPAQSSPSAFAGASATPWPSSDFPDNATAQQIAALLGGSVESLPVEFAGGTLDVPSVPWVVNSYGQIRVSDIIQAANNNRSSECAIEQQLATNIPGGQMSPQCASFFGAPAQPIANPTSPNSIAAPAIVPTISNPLPSAPAGVPSSTMATGADIGIVPPSNTHAASSDSAAGNARQRPLNLHLSSGGNVSTGTPGASVGNTGGSTDMVVGGFDVTQVASSIPWWGWALGAGAVILMMFSKGGR